MPCHLVFPTAYINVKLFHLCQKQQQQKFIEVKRTQETLTLCLIDSHCRKHLKKSKIVCSMLKIISKFHEKHLEKWDIIYNPGPRLSKLRTKLIQISIFSIKLYLRQFTRPSYYYRVWNPILKGELRKQFYAALYLNLKDQKDALSNLYSTCSLFLV